MNKKIGLICLVLLNVTFAKSFYSFNTGVSWPKALSTLEDSDQLAWNFGFDWGRLNEKKIGFSGVMDVMFKNSDEKTTIARDTTSVAGVFETYTYGSSIRRRQFSLGMGLWLNPLDESVVRPVIRGSFMPSMMVLINEFDKGDDEETVLPPSGAYWGYVATAGVDVHFMVSDNVSIFGGAGYRFGSVKRRIREDRFLFDESDDNNREYLRQPMEGFAIRLGVHFW